MKLWEWIQEWLDGRFWRRGLQCESFFSSPTVVLHVPRHVKRTIDVLDLPSNLPYTDYSLSILFYFNNHSSSLIPKGEFTVKTVFVNGNQSESDSRRWGVGPTVRYNNKGEHMRGARTGCNEWAWVGSSQREDRYPTAGNGNRPPSSPLELE